MNNKVILVAVVSVVVIGFYLLTEHRAHTYGILSYLAFPLFILAHFLMHAGHGNHGGKKHGGHH